MRSEYRGIVLEWAAASEVGRVRSLNEDSLLAEPPVFAVADGMGGHDAGEVASALAVERLASLIGDSPPAVDGVAEEFQQINELLRSATVAGQSVEMGTTVVALIVASNNGVPGWLIANIGDSRAYCVADGSFGQVTSDHSYVQELVDAGQINAAQARHHPDRNVVTQALGVVELARPDFWVRPFKAGERFLLCSDGLTGELEDAEIAEVLLTESSPAIAVHRLVERALAEGGRDNVTILVVDVLSTPTAGEASTETRPKRARGKRKPAAPKASERPVMPTATLAADAIAQVPLEAIPRDAELLHPGEPLGGSLIARAPQLKDAGGVAEPWQPVAAPPVEMITGAPPLDDAGDHGDNGSGGGDG